MLIVRSDGSQLRKWKDRDKIAAGTKNMTVRANKKKRGEQHRVEQCANLYGAYKIMACEKRNKPSKSQEYADVTDG